MPPLNIICKKFYTTNIGNTINPSTIFSACKIIMDNEKAGLFIYELDGLIFTPSNFGVGSNKIGEEGSMKVKTWKNSFPV